MLNSSEECSISKRAVTEECFINNVKKYNEVHTPLGDVIIEGRGYFYPIEEGLYEPLPVYVDEYNSKTDLSQIRYLIGEYKDPECEDNVCRNTITFLWDKEIETDIDSYLSVVFEIPNMHATNETLEILDLDLTIQ
jgi:hypothetical protein